MTNTPRGKSPSSTRISPCASANASPGRSSRASCAGVSFGNICARRCSSRVLATAAPTDPRGSRRDLHHQTAQPGRSDRARRPIIALALRIGGAVEYLALTASRTLGPGNEKAALATGLTRIRRLLSVVVQFALPVLHLTEGAGIGADEILLAFSVRNRDPAHRSGQKASREPPQGRATSLPGGECWQ